MQKKLIALAVAGLISAPVFAQSNVTVYGIVDAGMAYGEHGANEFQGLAGGAVNGNRVGFRGTEDLGNGLKAVFQLEQGFDIGNGTASPGVGTPDRDSVFSRQAYAGVSGAFGMVSMGRQYAPGYFTSAVDVVDGATASPQAILSGGAGLTVTPASPARWDNSLAYSGSFSGVSARLIYSARASETATSPDNDDAYGLSLGYDNGPIKLAAIYHQLNDAAASNDQKEWLVGGSYNFGVVALSASYQEGQDVGFVPNLDADVWTVAATANVGSAGKVILGYGEAEFDNIANSGAESYTLGYQHSLSKRTIVYAYANRTENESATGRFGLVGGGAVTGDNSDWYTVGIRHTF